MKMRVAHQPVLQVSVRFFGRYAEMLGTDQATVSVTPPATVADIIAALRARVPGAAQLPAAPLVAIDLEHVHGSRRVVEGEELAILPPLAGG